MKTAAEVEQRIRGVTARRAELADQIGAGVVDEVPRAVLEPLRAELSELDAELETLLAAAALLRERLHAGDYDLGAALEGR